MAITTLSQIGFYFLYESIFSPLFLWVWGVEGYSSILTAGFLKTVKPG